MKVLISVCILLCNSDSVLVIGNHPEIVSDGGIRFVNNKSRINIIFFCGSSSIRYHRGRLMFCAEFLHEMIHGDRSKAHKEHVWSTQISLAGRLGSLEILQEFLEEICIWIWVVQNNIEDDRYGLIVIMYLLAVLVLESYTFK